MSITKGIVKKENYTFDASAKTITFSSDYAGMSLSDITYITNVKSGVATVIYDPFDATKGGTLSGLTLTLAYDTTSMADTDPLQIIVGFVATQNDTIAETARTITESDIMETLQYIAENIDLLSKTTDENERVEMHVNDVSVKKDTTGALVLSDNVELPRTKTFNRVNEAYVVDNTGYNYVLFNINPSAGTSFLAIVEASFDGKIWFFVPYNTYGAGAAVNQVAAQTTATITVLTTAVGAFSIAKYTRLRVSGFTSGSAIVTASLKNIVWGAHGNVGPNINLLINNAAPLGNVNTATLPTSTAGLQGGLNISGIAQPTSGPQPVGASVLATNVPFPIGIGGRENPYPGALAGIFRYITVDGQGRIMIGVDAGSTPQNTVPARGVGGLQSTQIGAQALATADMSSSEGDTPVSLLSQILIELKVLNQQLNEIPFLLNEGVSFRDEPTDMRNDKTIISNFNNI